MWSPAETTQRRPVAPTSSTTLSLAHQLALALRPDVALLRTPWTVELALTRPVRRTFPVPRNRFRPVESVRFCLSECRRCDTERTIARRIPAASSCIRQGLMPANSTVLHRAFFRGRVQTLISYPFPSAATCVTFPEPLAPSTQHGFPRSRGWCAKIDPAVQCLFKVGDPGDAFPHH